MFSQIDSFGLWPDLIRGWVAAGFRWVATAGTVQIHFAVQIRLTDPVQATFGLGQAKNDTTDPPIHLKT